MYPLSKNASASLAVCGASTAILLVCCIWKSMDTVFAIGLTLGVLGMIQSYFGAVFESPATRPVWYFFLGLVLATAVGFSLWINIRDYATSWHWTVAVLAAALCLQSLISWIGVQTWKHQNHAIGPT